MPRSLSPRAQEILAELEAEAQRRRSAVQEAPAAVAAPPETSAVQAHTESAAADLPPAGVVELLEAAEEQCRRLQRRVACVADALGEAADQLRATDPTATAGAAQP